MTSPTTPAFHAEMFCHYFQLIQQNEGKTLDAYHKNFLQANLEYHLKQATKDALYVEVAQDLHLSMADFLIMNHMLEDMQRTGRKFYLVHNRHRVAMYDEFDNLLFWSKTTLHHPIKSIKW